ncbi:MAG: phosphoribosylanthranilate isomerase [Pirellulaceae bacterium]|nr:phosphoribosylanthranilate isomerase [Pirellulaceae bacterium]
MFRVKICGITNVGDGIACAEAGADALGFNFCAASPRCLTLELASEICESLPLEVARVGVFVNESVERIRLVAEILRLDWVQLHGDEPPEAIVQMGSYSPGIADGHRVVSSEPVPCSQRSFRVLRAFRQLDPEFQSVLAYLDKCQRLGALPDAVLVDAYQVGAYGGTGKTVNWSTASRLSRKLAALDDGQATVQKSDGVRDPAPPCNSVELATPGLAQPLSMALAGGLRPDNVAEAIRIVRPAAVDTASGVETSPGRKDARLVREFVERARYAFGRLLSDSDTCSV